VTTQRAAGVYAAVAIPAIVIGCMLESAAIDAINAFPRDTFGGWIDWPLNTIPALASGLATYAVLAEWVTRGPSTEASLRAHVTRSAALYGVFLITAVWLAIGWRSSDFWLVGQVVLWPCVTAIGGILADGVVSRQRHRTAV
jgi:hypothetical protein